jgi:hypothetical protein
METARARRHSSHTPTPASRCWIRGHQALPADVAAVAQGGERRLSHSQARRRGHALDALRLDGADAADRLDRRLKDGMLHGRSRAAEHRSSRLRPFHRRSDQRDDGVPRSCFLCLDASCADFPSRAGGAFPPFCRSGHDPDQNDSSPWKTRRIDIGFTRDCEFTNPTG